MRPVRPLFLVATLALVGSLAGCSADPPTDQAEPQAPATTLPYREDRDPTVRLERPVWLVGDQWTYELEPQDWETLCAGVPDPQRFISRDLVVGEGTRHDLPSEPEIYRVRSYLRGCSGEPIGERDRDWHKQYLAVLDDEGRWEEKLHFPLEDGKRWRYTPDGGIPVEAEATHIAQYAWDGQTVEAWKVELRSTQAEERSWFGVDAKNVLYRETFRREGDRMEPFGTMRLLGHRPAS